ncbi:MAG: uracil phosphoribosyltransferase [Polyangiaceae bacterium]|jgi:uracil phosphoribosyltransferase|nr:uracil phosphoribosyltransferase [Polyangiaceae bacterium]
MAVENACRESRLFPDPMGATGSSRASAVSHHKTQLEGRPERCIAIHLIVTPEYLRRMAQEPPDVAIYALRLDRGLSDGDVLKTVPGERWDEERGLNEHHDVVPGAGSVGEILNNAWV